MQLTEQHVIDRSDPRYAVIDAAAFASKNLYNAALYEMRQAFIFQRKRLFYNQMDKLMQQHEAYEALPAKVAQQVLRQLDKAWEGYFKACQAYREDPTKFTGHPKLPKYKHKTEGRNLLVYTDQAISKKGLKKGLIKPCMLPISVKARRKEIDQVRIVPRNGFYVVEVLYQKEPIQARVDPSLCVGIDLGVNNFAAIASNKAGFVPRLVNGRQVKAWNQWYNKQIKELKKQLPKEDRGRATHRMERITNKRTRRIDHFLHTVSRQLIDFLVEEGIGTIIIGKNDGWKQEANQGRHNNQNFVCIPHARFIDMLTYKAKLVGITVEVTEESYTSKASFLDLDPMPVYGSEDKDEHVFSGKRVKRGLYRTSSGRIINSDVQGAYNMIRKRRPDAFAKGVVDAVVVHPVRLARTNPKKAVS
jgi:putative transposase